VAAALARIDEPVVKLDAGTNDVLNAVNRPSGRLTVEMLVRRIRRLDHVTLQSLFLHGPADNTGTPNLALWAHWVRSIRPLKVQIYSIDREPALGTALPVPREELNDIAAFLEAAAGVPAVVY